jgi:CheY-like chemotaxis protein
MTEEEEKDMTVIGYNNTCRGIAIITQANKHYSYHISSEEEHSTIYDSQSFSSFPATASHSYLQDQESNNNNTKTTDVQERAAKELLCKRMLVVDDDPDLTLTFKAGLDGYYYNDRTRFEVCTYNNPLLALTQFKPHFYDLLLTDIYMPDMNGLQLSQKILEIDVNIRVCFMSAAEVNIQALREVYPKVSFGCFIKKPVTIEYLIKRLLAELD